VGNVTTRNAFMVRKPQDKNHMEYLGLKWRIIKWTSRQTVSEDFKMD
jgi:hypothetical protein